MSSQQEPKKEPTPKEKYDSLLKEIRTQKSLPCLEKIYEDLKQNRDHLYDNDVISLEFSDDFIWFLKYNLISTERHLDIFKLYIEEFFKMKCKPENLIKIKLINDIFTYDSNFYSRASNIDNFLVFLNRFFNLYYPKDASNKHKEGDYMDILISEERNKNTLNGWIQLKIKRIEEEKKLYIFSDYKDPENKKEIMISFDNFKVQERNTYVKEDEMKWRDNLKVGDTVDFLTDKKNWVKAIVREIMKDNEITVSTEDQDKICDIVHRYSPFIQPYLKYSFEYQKDELLCITLLEVNEDFQRFNYLVPFTDTNHLVPYDGFKFYSLEYYEILNFFINKIIETKILLNESTSIEYIYVILNILYSASYIVNQKFLGEYILNNVYDNVKKILMNFSLDKKMNKSKFILDNIILYLDKFLGYVRYPFQLCKFFPEFMIEFGFNCFKNSESLEKRLLGLHSIQKILAILNRFFTLISNDTITKLTALISDKLLGSDSNNDLLGLLFIDVNIHEQLLLKGVDIVINLVKMKFLDDKDIERLYNLALSAPADSDIYKSLYDLLNKITNDIELSQLKVLFDKIISFPHDKIRENDITLMSNVIQNIKSEKDFKDMTKTFLDYYYNYIIYSKNKLQDGAVKFSNILSFAKDDENVKYLYTHYFEKVLDDLNKQNNLESCRYFFDFMYKLFDSLKKRSERDQGSLPFLKEKFREIFLKNYKNMEIIVDKLMLLNDKEIKENKDNEEQCEQYITDIIDITKSFIEFVEEKNFYSVENMKKLSEYYLFSDVLRKKRNNFYFNYSELKNDLVNYEEFIEYFFNRLDKFLDTINPEHPERYKLIDSLFVRNIFSLYQRINDPIDSELYNYYIFDADSYNKLLEQKYRIKLNPLECKYFDIIWKMFLKLDDITEVRDFLTDFSLRNFSPKERHEIWEKLVQKIYDGIDTNILLSLQMLSFIINMSELYGNGGAKSHSIESKKKIKFELKLVNILTSDDDALIIPESEKETFYSTDCIYDVKSLIKKKYGIDPIFIDLVLNKNVHYTSTRTANNKSLLQVFPKIGQDTKENFALVMRKGRAFNTCPQYPYVNEEVLNPKFVQVLHEIFNRYANDNKYNLDKFKSNFPILFKDGKLETGENPKDISISYIYQSLNIEQKGYFTLEDFMQFMRIIAIKSQEKMTLFINNVGYAPNLDYYLTPLSKDSLLYYEENNVKEYMPRYFIGNKKEYMSKLFSYAKYQNKKIVENAQELIQEVCTMEELKKTLFERSNKIEEVISNPNLELRGYAFDILLTEFEKDDKDENEKIMVDNFIKNNLKKVILELEKFSESNDVVKEKKDEKDKENDKIIRYFNFYITNLQIIFYTFKNIMGNDDMINYIEKFDDLNDDNEKNEFKDVKFELSKENLEIIQSLQLNRLVNVIGKIIILTGNKITQIYRKAICLSIKILLYIIFFSKDLPEKEKTEIYTNFISNELIITQISAFHVKKSFHSANKLLLHFMNKESDKKFVLIMYDMFSKEILNYEKLNNLESKLALFFKIFIDLFDLSIKGTQNDKIFELYESMMKLILDKKVELKEYLLTGYLNIIKEILTILKNEKYEKIYDYDFESLINIIIKDFILIPDEDENGKIIEVENFKSYATFSEIDYVSYIYQILYIIISLNPDKYLKLFLLNDDIKNVREKHLTKLELSMTGYHPTLNNRTLESHMGLKNLSSICYMNSVIQQFFMMPLFRYSILSLPLPDNLPEEKEDTDNLLFQIIRMFYYLTYSYKGYYNPKDFVYSFKDYDGNPTKVNVQCDAQEFLSRLVEKIEDNLKNNSMKYMCNNILGGTTLQQVICTNPDCGNISERRENINFLSLDIKDVTSVEECLDKFIQEEKIEDYHCEKCDKKITNIKHVVIDKIPNILIIHLQRIAFSYETFNMEKINSYITFEKTLNIKKYTVNNNNENIPLEYFDYDLQGVIIHSGTAQYGHYYSHISPEEKDNYNRWFKFNDTSVSRVNYDSIPTEVFGNNNDHQYGSSAYMLIYQKTVKKPVIINSKALDENTKKILEEKKDEKFDTLELEKDKVYYVYENEKDAIEKNTDVNKLENEEDNINKNIIIKNAAVQANLVSYKEALDYLIKENNTDKEKKPFLKKILLENIKISNDKKFFVKPFSLFIKRIVSLLTEMIEKDKKREKNDEYLSILETINDYILYILPFLYNLDDLPLLIIDMVYLYKLIIPTELISHIIKDIIEPNKESFYTDYFISKENKKGNAISSYIGFILALAINNNIETELVNKTIQYYLDKIPVEITHHWVDMEAFNNLILILIESSDIIKKSFISNGLISKLMDYIMGKDSPLYQGDERIDNKNNKGKFGKIVKAIALLFQYYAENWEKEGLKLSKGDIIMIDCIKFYEKILIEDYDSEASNMLIDHKMKLISILNKEEDKEKFNNEIIDILIKLKIPYIKKREEIISGINLIAHIIKKYAEIYQIKETKEENKENNNYDKFIEKLNILLGVPIPTVNSGDAEIKYISGKYGDKYTILSNIFSEKEINKANLPLIKALYNLFNINKIVYDYIDNLPAPNTFKNSFIDYVFQFYSEIKITIEAESNVMDELEQYNPYKEYEKLINEVNQKYKTEKKINKYTVDNGLYFPEFFYEKINDSNIPDKISLYQMKLLYITMKKPNKTNLGCFTKVNYFSNLLGKQADENYNINNEYDIHAMICIVLHANEDLNLKINLFPYINSTIELEITKDYHYFLYCADIDDKIKDNNEEIYKVLKFDKIKIECEEKKVLALPQGNSNQESDNGCSINCPVCGTNNVLNESSTEFKCAFCESPLF